MKQSTVFLSLFFIFFSSLSFAQKGSVKENLFNKDKGFFTCNGGSSAPLFKQDCKELSLDRVSFGGDIVYEGSCLDSNGAKMILSCISFAFEPDRVVPSGKKNFFEQQ
jgi:hypothetical protein